MIKDELVEGLKKMGAESIKKVLTNHSAHEPFFGVRVRYMKTLLKKLMGNRCVTMSFYDTGISDTMNLCGLVAYCLKMSKSEIQSQTDGAFCQAYCPRYNVHKKKNDNALIDNIIPMKKHLLLFIFSRFCLTSFSQVREESMLIDKTKPSALRFESDYITKILSSVLSDKLISIPLKSGSSKRFFKAKGVKTQEISPELMGIYCIVEPVGKTRSAILLSLSKGYTNFLTAVGKPESWQNAKSFLINFSPFAENLKIKEEASEKAKELKKSENSYNKSVSAYKKQEEVLSKAVKEMESAPKIMIDFKAEIEGIQRRIKL
jgi:hypothetical protein